MKFCRNCGSALGTTPGAPALGVVQTLPQTPSVMPSAGKPAPIAAALPPTAAMAPAPSPMQMAAAAMPTPVPTPAMAQPRAQGSTIPCPRCGTATPVGFAYCQGCGLHIQPIAPTDPGAAAMAQRPKTSTAQPLGSGTGVDAFGGTLAAPDARSAAALGAVTPLVRPPTNNPAPAARPSTANLARGAQWGTAVLVNRDGSDGQRFALTSDDTLIGRTGCDIAFDDDRFLAQQHARLSRLPDGTIQITALDTLNGVFKKTDGSVELAEGTTILVGREVLRFEKLAADERTVHPLVRHGVALFGSPPREPWGRLLQLIPSGGYRDVRHLATDEVVLGREEGDIVFRDDAFMSRRHAALTWDGKRAQLTDLGSSNGTFVRINGPTTLKQGDHVRMGDQLLRIER